MSHRYKRSITKNIGKFMNSISGPFSSQEGSTSKLQKKKEELNLTVATSGCLDTPVHDQFSIVQYCPSQIVFVKDNICTGNFEYLKNRPLIVMRVHPFTTLTSVTCITCGSSGDMHGINLHLNGISADKNKITQAHPWAVVGLNMGDIARSAGFIREDDFSAIKQAFLWHMTGVGEKPKYLEERNTEFNAPPERLKSTIGSRISNFGLIPPLESAIEDPDTYQPIIVRERSSDSHTINMKGNEYTLVYDSHGKLGELPPEVKEIPALTTKAQLIIDSLTDNETAQVLGRVIKAEDLIRVYHCSKGTAAIVKSYITAEATTKENIKRILKRTNGSKRNVSLLSHLDRVTLSVWIPAEVSGFSEEYLDEIQRQEGVPEVKAGRLWEGYRSTRNQILAWFKKA